MRFWDRRFAAVDRQFTEVALRFDRVDQHVGEVRESIADLRATRRIEVAFADEQGWREILPPDVAERKQQVAGFQSRIAEIEQRLRA